MSSAPDTLKALEPDLMKRMNLCTRQMITAYHMMAMKLFADVCCLAVESASMLRRRLHTDPRALRRPLCQEATSIQASVVANISFWGI